MPRSVAYLLTAAPPQQPMTTGDRPLCCAGPVEMMLALIDELED